MRPLDEMGFDSLMAMSLKLAVEEKLGISIAATELRVGLTLSLLVKALFDYLEEGGDAIAEETGLTERHVPAEAISETLRAKIIKETDSIVEGYVELE